MPVFPLVGSMIVPPGRNAPARSAASTIAIPTRSFTLPPGFRPSTFASNSAPPSLKRDSRTSGVPPTASSTESKTAMKTSFSLG